MSWGALAGGAITGALSYLGGTEANSANALQAEYNRGFNAEEARKNREFQERMRATQYQTTVADLKSAGLNPMLAYVQGGAGNVAGSAATGSMPAPMENVLGKVGNSAREGAMAVQQYENLKTQNFALEQQGEQAASQALLNKDQAAKTRMETTSEMLKQPGFKLSGEERLAFINMLKADARQSHANSARTEAMQPEAVATGKTFAENPNLKTTGEYIRQIGEGVNSASSAINAVRGKPRPTINYNYGVR